MLLLVASVIPIILIKNLVRLGVVDGWEYGQKIEGLLETQSITRWVVERVRLLAEGIPFL
jgi:hypothetical protein